MGADIFYVRPAGKREREREKNVYDVIERYEIRMVAPTSLDLLSRTGRAAMDPQRPKEGMDMGRKKSMNQFFYSRAGAQSRKKRRRNERKRGRDKIPRVKRAPVVNIVGISPLRFPRNIFPLIVPLLFFSCQTNRATTSNGRHTN